MIKCLEFGDKVFATKDEMFKALKANEEKLIAIKKAKVYKSCEKGQLSFLNLTKSNANTKANFEVKSDYIYPVISTTRYMDSHKDVHFDGCFNHTVKDQQGTVMYALDHELKWNSILAWQKDVKMFVSPIDWVLVGKDYMGTTEGLVFEISKDKITKSDVLKAIESNSMEFENSIRMTYVKIKLGINSKEKDLAENKAYYDLRIGEIANKSEAEEEGYFWGVEELRIYKEGSLVVAGGSNDATSIILEAAESTSFESEPQKHSEKSVWDDFITPEQNSINWSDYLN
jgi:hypothetical protein